MSSIREVAKLAGVSPATVSRVMNGTANVNIEKKQRVLKAIDETGFMPNEVARSLYKKSSKIIGVIVPTNENPFFNELVKSIEEEIYLQGYRFMICNSNSDYKKEIDNIRVLTQLNADGMIFMTNHEKAWKEVQNCELPVVVMDRQLEDSGELAYIQSDHYKGGRIAAEHLLECGCKNIVNMRGPQKFSSGRQRFEGYKDVCVKHSIPVQYIESGYDYQDGYRAVEHLIEAYPEVDGIIASNDITAIAAYKYLNQQGYRIPEDIQLIGFDNISLSWQLTPELTTISQPVKEMGALAARLIIDHVEGEKIQKENVFDVQLIQRDTTAVPHSGQDYLIRDRAEQ